MQNIKHEMYDNNDMENSENNLEMEKIKQEFDSSIDDFQPKFLKKSDGTVDEDQNKYQVDEGHNEYQKIKGQNERQNNKYEEYVDMMIIHEGKKAYKCESCGKSYTSTGFLQHHIDTVHEVQYQVNEEQSEYQVNDGQKEYQCDICNFSSSYSADLKFHMKSVHGGKCYECGKIYTNPGAMKKHYISVHQANKFQMNIKPFPYECNSCGKTFSTAYYIKPHIGKYL